MKAVLSLKRLAMIFLAVGLLVGTTACNGETGAAPLIGVGN